MSFLDRLAMAGQVLFSGKTAYDSMSTWQRGQAIYPQTGFRNNVLLGYQRNELIYTCISLKADSAASAKLVARNKAGKDLGPEHPLLNVLAMPNPHMTMFDFVAAILIHLDLAGLSYWEKVRSRAGRTVQLWPLRPDWMAPIPDDKGGLKGYEYRVPGIAPVPLNAQDVLKFRLYDPLDMYGGQAPVSVAARSGYIDNSTTDFVKQLLEEGAVPPGIITSKQKLIEQQVEDIRRRWQNRYGGFRNWKAPAILDSEATYQRTGMTLTEMGFEVLDERSESRICSVLKVPTILVGTKIGLGRSTFSNYAEARKTFWQDGLMPQYKRIRDELQRDLGPEYDGNAVLAWDFSDVPGLMEDQNTRWERATRALAAGGITVNMFLEEIGKDPVGTDGEVFLRGLNQQAVPLKRPATTGKILPFEGKGAVADNAPDDSLRRKHEHGMQRELSTFFDEQMARVREALANVA